MDAIVEVLLEKETMTGDEFRAVLSKYATMPQVRRAADAHSPRSSCITASLLGRAACTSAALGVLPMRLARPRLCCGCCWGTPARAGQELFKRSAERSRPAHPLTVQENIDAVARQKQPDAELQLA